MRKQFFFIAFSLIAACCLLFAACAKDQFNLKAQVAFSADTLRFDTVFVARGSATRVFKIYNRQNEKLRISEIKLAGGSASQYRINIDGSATLSAKDVEMEPHDSLYVFVQVNIDPNNANAPFVVTDEVQTVTNGVTQHITLEAFGQNANYIGSRAGGAVVSNANGNTVWNSAKPYVIYGWLVVEDCNWVISPGTRIYVHGGVVNKNGIFADKAAYPYFDGVILIKNTAHITAEGTVTQGILFAGDRLEHDKVPTIASLDYSQTPGQWSGIWLAPASQGNSFAFCTIKNGAYGIQADSASSVVLRNTVIHNQAAYAIAAKHPTNITAENCLFFSASDHLLALTYGGTYRFEHCTMACYGSPDYITHDKKSTLLLTNSFCYAQNSAGQCLNEQYNALQADFRNCLVYGSLNDEVLLDKKNNAPFAVNFEYCLLKRTDATLNEVSSLLGTRFDKPLANSQIFRDVDKLNYHLDSVYQLVYKGTGSALTTDLLGKPRAAPPTMGCYEEFK